MKFPISYSIIYFFFYLNLNLGINELHVLIYSLSVVGTLINTR